MVEYDPAKRIKAIFRTIVPSIVSHAFNQEARLLMLDKYEKKAHILNKIGGFPYEYEKIEAKFADAFHRIGVDIYVEKAVDIDPALEAFL